MALFRQMQPSEQWHAALVVQRLKEAGQDHPALLTAALLHEESKILYPLSPLERAEIMLGKKFFPRLASRWGRERGGIFVARSSSRNATASGARTWPPVPAHPPPGCAAGKASFFGRSLAARSARRG
jgi:hypothetical protein